MLGRSGELLVPSPGSARFPCSRTSSREHGNRGLPGEGTSNSPLLPNMDVSFLTGRDKISVQDSYTRRNTLCVCDNLSLVYCSSALCERFRLFLNPSARCWSSLDHGLIGNPEISEVVTSTIHQGGSPPTNNDRSQRFAQCWQMSGFFLSTAEIFLLPVGRSAVTHQCVTPAMRSMNDDGDHRAVNLVFS